MKTLDKLESLKQDILSGDIDHDGIEDGFNRIIEDFEASTPKQSDSNPNTEHLSKALGEAFNEMEPSHGRAIMSGMFDKVMVPVGTYTLVNGQKALVLIVITAEEDELESVEDIELPELIRK